MDTSGLGLWLSIPPAAFMFVWAVIAWVKLWLRGVPAEPVIVCTAMLGRSIKEEIQHKQMLVDAIDREQRSLVSERASLIRQISALRDQLPR